MERLCAFCSIPFDAPIGEVNRGNAKFCTRSCSSRYHAAQRQRKKVPNVICAYCNEPFYKPACRITTAKHGLHFCCREHKDLAQRIGGISDIQPAHYGSGNSRYREIAFRNYPPCCAICNYDRYPEVLEVHHRDRDRHNNDVGNLQILCPTCHAEHHYAEGTGKWAA